MGPKASQPVENSDDLKINHPKFQPVTFIETKDGGVHSKISIAMSGEK